MRPMRLSNPSMRLIATTAQPSERGQTRVYWTNLVQVSVNMVLDEKGVSDSLLVFLQKVFVVGPPTGAGVHPEEHLSLLRHGPRLLLLLLRQGATLPLQRLAPGLLPRASGPLPSLALSGVDPDFTWKI